MHRKFWFLVAAAVAVFALTGTAAATSGRQAMTQFQKDWANIKWSPQARATAGQVNFGMEQSISGFNGLDSDETLFWASVTGEVPVIRGNYIVTNTRAYRYDLASLVTSDSHNLTINIKPNADWFIKGQGDVGPVQASDYALTYNVIMDPRNPIASTTGYDDINQNNPFTIVNSKKIVFHWAHPFADWRDLFGFILPGVALPTANQLGSNSGQAFNEMWRDCVCVQTLDGNGDVVDGAPVSDGPFYVDSYDPGTGVIDKPNHTWYGDSGSTGNLTQANFIRTTPGSTEANGLQSGQLDAAFPAPAAAYVGLRSDPNFVYNSAKGFTQEHIDFNEANPLLAHPWMRQAFSLAINRPAVIKAVYYDTGIIPSGGMSQLNSTEYVLGKYSVSPYDYYKTWNFSAQRAINILAQHCTGGPTNPTPNAHLWSCDGNQTIFDHWTTTLPTRAQSATIYQDELSRVGIQLNIHTTSGGNLFGNILPGAQSGSCINYNTSPPTPQACGADTYDTAEYAWVGGADPSGFNAIYECYDTNGKGGQNYKNFCKYAINKQQAAGDIDLTSTRYQHYLKVSQITANNAFIFPLYARPNILIYSNSIGGGIANANNPTSVGPTWNMENWTSN